MHDWKTLKAFSDMYPFIMSVHILTLWESNKYTKRYEILQDGTIQSN